MYVYWVGLEHYTTRSNPSTKIMFKSRKKKLSLKLMTVDLTVQQHNIIDVSFEFPRFVVGDLQLHQNCFFFILFFILRKK